MLYVLRQGKNEQKLLEAALRERRPPPPSIQDAPELMVGLEIYYSAWLDLQSCRQVGMAEGPIPWTAVNEYAHRNGLSEDQHDDLQYFIVVLDQAYFEHRKEVKEREDAAKARKKPGQGAKQTGPRQRVRR